MHDLAVSFRASAQDSFRSVPSLIAFRDPAFVIYRKRVAVIWLAHVQLNRYGGFIANAKRPLDDDHRNQTIPKRLAGV